MIKQSVDWVSEQGRLRNAGQPNAIDPFLENTVSAKMDTGDFMFYYADIFVESVQYGNRTLLCNTLKALSALGATQQEIFRAMTKFGSAIPGVNPPDYDANIIAIPAADPFGWARPWTY